MKISVVVNTLNVEDTLERALKSVSKYVDEIVICDDGSSDKTLEIAKKFTNLIFKHKGEGFVEKSRNFAVGKANGDWVLVLDADEEITDKLGQRLRSIACKKSGIFVLIPRKNIIFGKWIRNSGWWPDYNIRFFKKGKVKWTGKIHEDPQKDGDGLTLDPDEDLAIIHHNYKSITQFLERMNLYTNVEAHELKSGGYEFNWRDLISKPVGEFLSRYFSSEGFKDGLHGLVLAALQSFSFFVTYLKVWEIEGFKEQEMNVDEVKEEFGKKGKELKFWFFKALLTGSSGAERLIFKLRQKLTK